MLCKKVLNKNTCYC
ncbi:hypothetical protein EOL70_30690 [Leucothrix sargassi]|nr:hypothetical protein EOL70_30690 [Leucothrix sargassi]